MADHENTQIAGEHFNAEAGLFACWERLTSLVGYRYKLRYQQDNDLEFRGVVASRPNVIIVITDDQGYGDLACHGNPVAQTPNMDRLHAESVRFTDFHAAPMCTPTRGQLLSGLDAARNGAVNVSNGRSLLRAELPTMVDLFRAAGYSTGMFGKWHMGDNYPYRPQDRGFEQSLWFPSSHISSLPDYWENDYFDDVYCRNGVRERHEGTAVLWQRWRLLEGTALYELDSDPGQDHNVIEQHPDIARKMADALDRWWKEVEPFANEVQRITIGSDAENPSMLSACEWQDVFVDQQRQVRIGVRKNSYWHLLVDRAGTYTFELRRWPRESGLSLSERGRSRPGNRQGRW